MGSGMCVCVGRGSSLSGVWGWKVSSQGVTLGSCHLSPFLPKGCLNSPLPSMTPLPNQKINKPKFQTNISPGRARNGAGSGVPALYVLCGRSWV